MTTAKLTPGSSISGFVDTKTFSGGRARLKILAEPSSSARGTLRARFLAKNGRELNVWQQTISGATVYNELQLDTEGLKGYLQLTFLSETGQLTLKRIKLEVLTDG